jgi:hypothetical protein
MFDITNVFFANCCRFPNCRLCGFAAAEKFTNNLKELRILKLLTKDRQLLFARQLSPKSRLDRYATGASIRANAYELELAALFTAFRTVEAPNPQKCAMSSIVDPFLHAIPSNTLRKVSVLIGANLMSGFPQRRPAARVARFAS